MAKNDATQKEVEIEIGPKEIARALEGISDWINSVRSTVLQLDPNATVKMKRKLPAAVMAPSQVRGCPPPDPCADDDNGKPPKPPRRPRKKG